MSVDNKDEFYNPYQFIPFKDTVNDQPRLDTEYEDILSGATQVRHDAWLADALHGELRLSLTTVSPTCVGNVHTESVKDKKASVVKLYQRKGQPAIPGSSFTGYDQFLLLRRSPSPI